MLCYDRCIVLFFFLIQIELNIMKNYFSEEDKKKIIATIQAAELKTSGEIRVHIDKTCNEDVLDRAVWWFKKLNMHKTAERNGVLIYIAMESRRFAIIGDLGINAVVPKDFWEEVKEEMLSFFKNNEFVSGIAHGVSRVGDYLKLYFPYKKDDVNELSDDISFGTK